MVFCCSTGRGTKAVHKRHQSHCLVASSQMVVVTRLEKVESVKVIPGYQVAMGTGTALSKNCGAHGYRALSGRSTSHTRLLNFLLVIPFPLRNFDMIPGI